MKLFYMRQPRRFEHKMIYSHERDFHIRREQSRRHQSSLGMVTLVVLLGLLLALWYYLG